MSFLPDVDREKAFVLFADDDPRMRTLLTAELDDLNIPSISFDNAFDLLRDFQQYSPSFVFLDLLLPQMTGVECVKRLRMSGYKKPVFIVSALYDSGYRQKAFDAGADDFFLKSDFFRRLRFILSDLL